MSSEITQRIYAAEALRVAGKTKEATQLALEGRVKTDPDLLSIAQLSDQARLSRIVVVSSLTTARHQWLAKSVVAEMQPARDQIVNFYNDELIRKRLRLVDRDNQGNTYEMLPEMDRDKYSFHRLAFLLTGNRQFFGLASTMAILAVSRAKNPGVAGVTALEYFQLLNLVDKDPNKRLRRYEKEIHPRHEETIRAIEQSRNRDRLGWYLLNLKHETRRLDIDETADKARTAFRYVNVTLDREFKWRGSLVMDLNFNYAKFMQYLRIKAWRSTRRGIKSSMLELH